MSNRIELNSYIDRIRQRLLLVASVRGTAIFTGTALIVTIALVVLLNQFAFPLRGLAGARLALFAALATAAAFGLAFPLVRLTHARAVRKAEAANSAFEHRLTTFYEKEHQGGGDPFLELLAADTLTSDAACRAIVPWLKIRDCLPWAARALHASQYSSG